MRAPYFRMLYDIDIWGQSIHCFRIIDTTPITFDLSSLSLIRLCDLFFQCYCYYRCHRTIQWHQCHGRRDIDRLVKIIHGRASSIISKKEKPLDPRNDAGAITGQQEPIIPLHNHYRREVPGLSSQSTRITWSDSDPLRRVSIRKSQKWIRTRYQEILHLPITQRFSHSIQGRPDQDARAQKQESQNAVHITIERKKTSRDWSSSDPSSNPGIE